jgi:hypothetical protein
MEVTSLSVHSFSQGRLASVHKFQQETLDSNASIEEAAHSGGPSFHPTLCGLSRSRFGYQFRSGVGAPLCA